MGMTKFEKNGVAFQQECYNQQEARRAFERSCEMCASRGLSFRQSCSDCPISEMHTIMMAVLPPRMVSTRRGKK